MARQELLPSPQGARHGRRCPPDDGAHSSPILEEHRLWAAAGPEGRGREPLAWHRVVVVDKLSPTGRVPDQGEPAAPDRTHQRLRYANGRRRGDRSVGCVATRTIRLRSGFGRVWRTRGGGEGRVGACSLHNWLLCTVFSIPCRPGPENAYHVGNVGREGVFHCFRWCD